MCWNTSRGASLSSGPFRPITGEKMLSFSLSFEFKYRKDLSVLFYVLLANMKSPY